MSSPDSNADAQGDYDGNLQDQDQDAPIYDLPVPPERSYPDKQSLMADVQEYGRQHGYNVVVKTSSIPTPSKPHRIAKVWLRCDKGGTYRPRNGLTEETRKRKRSSRLVNCPFQLQAVCENGMWFLRVLVAHHNHPPNDANGITQPNSRRPKKGLVPALPYDWPASQSLNPFSTALVIIDMQRDFCEHGGYLTAQGYSVDGVRKIIPNLVNILSAFRASGFPVYHTREGHRPDLSTLSDRERVRSKNNPAGIGIGDPGPLGRFLVRGEPGHDTIPELYPIEGEPVIDKPGRGAFAHTDFELLLRIKGIRNLIICGVTTDVCVSTTMREANDRAFDCLLLEDATAAAEPSLCSSTLESVKMEGGIFGAVGKTVDVINAIEGVRKTLRAGRATSPQPDQIPNTMPAPQTPAHLLSTMSINGLSASLTGTLPGHMAAAAVAAGNPLMPMDPQMSSPYLHH
ncbi:putative isochorismatase family [Phaeomoniella chlamydospora]|uniref:Putative isochorismatase family n=1 Tax=Phaeomoniella chlamydospora TaxID=158046 RepID=A0A0G2EGT3_PHACM|nr:putative isochorismatase family [Phaeomoniella chlamydospora]